MAKKTEQIKMKILLTNSPLQYFHAHAFLQPDWGGALGLAQLAAMVDEGSNEIKILDNIHSWFKPDTILKNVKEFKPDIIGVSNAIFADTKLVLEKVKEIKKIAPKAILICGGQAASHSPETMLKGGFDFTVIGEGETTFRELVSSFKNNADFSNIKGVAYKSDDNIIRTPEREFEKNLDSFPPPARKYLKPLKSKFFPGRYSSEIETSRGCPSGCHYCGITAFWKRSYRKKSNEKIMEELTEMKKRGISQAYFIDDTFGIKVDEYAELFKMMIKENLDIKWFTQIRADTIANNPDMIRLAKEAGFWGGEIGFESYDDNVLKGVGKLGSREINLKAAKVCRENDLVTLGVHMFGLPNQTEEEMKKTFEYGRRNSDIFRMSMFSPLPGTPLFEKYKAEGKLVSVGDPKHPYNYSIKDKDRDEKRLGRLYFGYQLKYYFSPSTILNAIFSRGARGRMKILSYVSAARYCVYALMRKIGLKIL